VSAQASRHAAASPVSCWSASCMPFKAPPRHLSSLVPRRTSRDEAPGSGQARQAGPSLRLELHPVLPPSFPTSMPTPSTTFLPRVTPQPQTPPSLPTRILVGAGHGF
jgi:hypothetical protein